MPHSDQLLDAALVAAIEAALTGIDVFLLRAERGIAAPYVIVQNLSGNATGSVMDQDDHTSRYQVTYVGVGPEQASGMADRAHAALVMQFLTVTDRHCGPVELEYSPPDMVDEDAGKALFLKRKQYSIPSRAA